MSTLCVTVIQDQKDPKIRIGFRSSTKNWSKDNKLTPMITFLLPSDFGSKEYYKRREPEFKNLFNLLNSIPDLGKYFENHLESSNSLRDYLWVNDEYSEKMAREAVKVVPKQVLLSFLDWTVKDFGKRKSGWPDLFLSRSGNILFAEVKSPSDKLSKGQMEWIRWALTQKIPFEICRVKKKN